MAIALAATRRPDGPPHVTLADAEDALGTRALRYGRDDHYDVISAFIKSIRGSDPDAGLYWLARMLEAGEDARFIARRLVILASEDVGMADPMGLVVADAAARAVEFVGLPEAQLNLAQAVVHLATAPKSNRTGARRSGTRREDVRKGAGGEVPVHLRDAHYQGAKVLGHGKGYDYPHDDPRGWVPQEYRPADVADRVYYEPSDHGFEQEVGRRMERANAQDGTRRDGRRPGAGAHDGAVRARLHRPGPGPDADAAGDARAAVRGRRPAPQDRAAPRRAPRLGRGGPRRPRALRRVLGSAEAISSRVEGASRVARMALSTPVIKTVALATGTGKAARRLGRRNR